MGEIRACFGHCIGKECITYTKNFHIILELGNRWGSMTELQNNCTTMPLQRWEEGWGSSCLPRSNSTRIMADENTELCPLWQTECKVEIEVRHLKCVMVQQTMNSRIWKLFVLRKCFSKDNDFWRTHYKEYDLLHLFVMHTEKLISFWNVLLVIKKNYRLCLVNSLPQDCVITPSLCI